MRGCAKLIVEGTGTEVMMMAKKNSSKWWGLVVVLLLSFSAVNVWALTPLPVNDPGNLAQEVKQASEKVLTKVQKAQSIMQKAMDLVQKGYGAMCKAYAAAAKTIQAAQEKLNELQAEGLAAVKNLGKCGVDVSKKIAQQVIDDKKQCKEEFKDDADGYKKCLEDAKANRKVMKKTMIAECKKQMNQAAADTMAKTKAEAKDIGDAAAQEAKEIKNSFSWGKSKDKEAEK